MFRMALSEANRALVQLANNLTARMAKAEALYTLYMFRMALSEANRALGQQANNLTARMAKAEALYTLYMFEEALVLFTRIKRLRPTFPQGSNKIRCNLLK
jgi:hypothetical protein